MIFGVTGQIGSHLADILLDRGFYVVGVSRRVSLPNTARIRHLEGNGKFSLVGGDVTDPLCCYQLMIEHAPDQVYNFAAQSHVAVSFQQPSLTWQVTAQGALNLLEAIRHHPRRDAIRFYQASSSEMFGGAYSVPAGDGCVEHLNFRPFSPEKLFWEPTWGEEVEGGRFSIPFQSENTPFEPNSPYACAKLAAHHAVRVYRESYGLHASCGIMFNSEGPRRSKQFVTRKVTSFVAAAHKGKKEKLSLGNLKAVRDWGYAGDTAHAAYLMLCQDEPDDYCVATGEAHTVEELLGAAFGPFGMDWKEYVRSDTSLHRPCEVPYLRGCADKARSKLGWQPSMSFQELITYMVNSDLNGWAPDV